MGRISGSHQCHEVLSAQPIGWEFTHATFKQVVHQHYPELTDGVITGFLTRAKKMGMITIRGLTKTHEGRKSVFKYRLEEVVEWQFKSAGIGSYKGRGIMGRHHDKPIDTPESLGQLIEGADTKSAISREAAEKLGVPVVDLPVSEHSHDDMAGIPVLEAEIEYDQGSISDQLINLAIKVNDLENRPVKTLADYSTNDLIEELKKRIK